VALGGVVVPVTVGRIPPAPTVQVRIVPGVTARSPVMRVPAPPALPLEAPPPPPPVTVTQIRVTPVGTLQVPVVAASPVPGLVAVYVRDGQLKGDAATAGAATAAAATGTVHAAARASRRREMDGGEVAMSPFRCTRRDIRSHATPGRGVRHPVTGEGADPRTPQ
jgi:hypothetical protein